ncbi:MAG: ABC transporter permease subunit [Deltaproteobacteria bacterium]|nr:ABC transporter permease subunit [Deltaproteobacteria bacterium]
MSTNSLENYQPAKAAAPVNATVAPLGSVKPSASRNVLALARRELGFYFNSPIAYIVITLFLVVCGAMLFIFDTPDTGRSFFETNEASLRALFGPTSPERFGGIPLVFAFLVPALTMRLISEEKRTGTIELLVTWPITDPQIVLGKYLAGLAFVAIMLVFTLPLAFMVGGLGPLDAGMVIGGYLGLLLVGATYLAIGLMTSSWTKNQINAYLVGVLLCAFFYFVDGMVGAVWAGARDFFAALSIKAHFQNVARGVVDLRDLVFYGSLIAVCLVVTVQSLQARNWKK